MKIGVKLISAFLVVSAITGVVGFVGVDNMGKLNQAADDLYQNELLGVSYIKQANVGIVSVGRGLRNAILASTQEERDQYIQNIHKRLPEIQDDLDKASKLFRSEKAKHDLSVLHKDWTQYQSDIKQIGLNMLNSCNYRRFGIRCKIALDQKIIEVQTPVMCGGICIINCEEGYLVQVFILKGPDLNKFIPGCINTQTILPAFLQFK